MKQFFLLFTLSLSIISYAACEQDLTHLSNWLDNPQLDTAETVMNIGAELNEAQLLNLLQHAESKDLMGQLLIAGLLARNDSFVAISPECLQSDQDLIKAICLAALFEWHGQRGGRMADAQIDQLEMLTNSENQQARYLVVMTAVATQRYRPELFDLLIEVAQIQFKDQSFQQNWQQTLLVGLAKMTALDERGLTVQQQIEYFNNWRTRNAGRLQPSTWLRGETLVYRNVLEGFSMNLPSDFFAVHDPQLIAGTISFFANDNGQSVVLESHPVMPLQEAFIEVASNLDIKADFKLQSVQGIEFVEFEKVYPAGKLKGRLYKLKDRLLVVNAFVPKGSDLNLLDSLLAGVEFLN